MTQLGNKIRSLREARNMTKPQLAGLLGVTTPAVYHLENGSRKPSYDVLIRLVKVFEVSTDELTGMSAEQDKAIEAA